MVDSETETGSAVRMANKDPRVDAYIEQAADFAKPILKHLRKLVHAGCPEVEETIKWRFPAFVHRGMLCSMASFKQHCTFGFWQYKLLAKDFPELGGSTANGMGQLGKMTAKSDLPSDRTFARWLKRAIELNESGVKKPRPARSQKPKLVVLPDYFAAALKKNPKARTTFAGFSPSHKREYVDWLIEAKREETRERRLQTALEWLAEGKPRNWKYMNCGAGSKD